MNEILSTLRPADLLRLAIKETERRLIELRNALELIDGTAALQVPVTPKQLEQRLQATTVQLLEPMKPKPIEPGVRFKSGNEYYHPRRDSVLAAFTEPGMLLTLTQIRDVSGASFNSIYEVARDGYLNRDDRKRYSLSDTGKRELARVSSGTLTS